MAGHHQALGMLLIALGVLIFFLLSQLWIRTRKDPGWILRGEFRDWVRPGALHIINSLLLILGGILGTGAFGLGLVLLRWV